MGSDRVRLQVRKLTSDEGRNLGTSSLSLGAVTSYLKLVRLLFSTVSHLTINQTTRISVHSLNVLISDVSHPPEDSNVQTWLQQLHLHKSPN